MSWIGVDLDGTLAYFDGKQGGDIGEPIPKMVARVQAWLELGREVRIVTARVSRGKPEVLMQTQFIDAWCVKHVGRKLPITCKKDFGMEVLWDDRCVQVEKNTGERVGNHDGVPLTRASA